MSDEKPKPFAEAFPPGASVVGGSGDAWPSVSVVGGKPWLLTGRFADVADLMNVVNAAVEQREAKLRGAILDMANELWHDSHREDIEAWVAELLQNRGSELRAALAGTGPDYVPRAQLDEANAKLKSAAAMFDALNDGDRLPDGSAVVAWLEANGWRKPAAPSNVIEALAALANACASQATDLVAVEMRNAQPGTFQGPTGPVELRGVMSMGRGNLVATPPRRFHSFVAIEAAPSHCHVCGMHRDSDAHASF